MNKEKNKNKETELEDIKHDACECENCSCSEDISSNNPSELELAKMSILELQNKLMYTQADSINYRKRKEEEVANMLKYANQDLILDMLNIVENFDRAASSKAETEEAKKIQSGISMINSQLKDVLKNYGVVEIEALGYPFDSNYMEAMMVENNPDKPDDMVLEVLIKGYKYKERVIKPAVVKVNKIEN